MGRFLMGQHAQHVTHSGVLVQVLQAMTALFVVLEGINSMAAALMLTQMECVKLGLRLAMVLLRMITKRNARPAPKSAPHVE